jgi:hypothetical protein
MYVFSLPSEGKQQLPGCSPAKWKEKKNTVDEDFVGSQGSEAK